jgi:hypothetical protein
MSQLRMHVIILMNPIAAVRRCVKSADGKKIMCKMGETEKKWSYRACLPCCRRFAAVRVLVTSGRPLA